MADFSKARMYRWFLRLLEFYLDVYPIAHIINLEIGFKLNLPHKTSVRKPDLALFLLTNLVQMADEERTYWGVFDLCVEYVPDSTRAEIERDTITKKGEYETGVQEYYILDDQHQYTTFYELTASGVYQPIQAQAGIIASRVLSDFQFRIEDLYRQRPWEDLVEDQVYQHFVLPAYVAEKERLIERANALMRWLR